MITTESIRARIEALSEKADNGCVLWKGATRKKDGYAVMSAWGKSRFAHRVSYEVFVGPIPEGKELDHLCRNRNCINPEHLQPVTHRENVLRGKSPSVIARHAGTCKRGHEMIRNRAGLMRCPICQRMHNRNSRARRLGKL